MTKLDSIPTLPDSAPFTAEQRAYLNGFLAGILSRAPLDQPHSSQKPPAETLVPLAILFGSQTGNAENLAKRAAKEAGKRGFAPTIHDLGTYSPDQLVSEKHALIITSTYGEGEPPDNAKAFWNSLRAPEAQKLPALRFAICALGDSNYPAFCGFGRDLDQRLESLGACRLHPRVECDVDFEEPFAKWISEALNAFEGQRRENSKLQTQSSSETSSSKLLASEPDSHDSISSTDVARFDTEVFQDHPLALPLPLPSEALTKEGRTAFHNQNSETSTGPKHSKTNPFPAPLLTNKKLNAPGSSKETRHFEFSLANSDLPYQAGDALGVFPANCPDLVNEILAALHGNGDESVPGRSGATIALREALLHDYEITRIPRPLLSAMAERSGDAVLKKLASPQANGELTAFLYGREIIDLLLAYPAVKFTPAEFVAFLKKLPVRLYSISSSPKAYPREVHLTVNIVRYESLSRHRKGVCSTFLADRVPDSSPVPVFVHTNKNFRPPTDAATPMIMVGPGTGIAPFRAFLQERRAIGAIGKNWLFFGDQRAATDFMYRDELEAMRQDRTLTRLDLAFSRDQGEKVYVQHRMLENSHELWSWLESGAHFYVCGDASRMAKDVDATLHQIVEKHGGKSPEEATAYVAKLKSDKRYQRDVY